MKKILKEIYLYLIIIVVLSMIFNFVINSPLQDYIERFDIYFFNSLQYMNLVLFMKIFTFIGDGYIPILIVILLIILVREKKYTLILLSGYIFSALLTHVTKIIISKPRPVFSLIDLPTSYSFPSGHTLTSFVFFILLAYILTLKGDNNVKIISIFFALIVSLLIGLSRIYLGVHYASDVFGGILLSIPSLLIFIKVVNIYNKQLK